ncbi:MAG TPA: UDP-N-acetylmuramate dehydrogenase [Verrucomicrobiae bacterium]|jgi:UDP-N-acetylenolpyruvoylglucosamine reductase|nr:UDP-N-acetylmuramate dehydrogenase [Verrucomicrobiae bacterium]
MTPTADILENLMRIEKNIVDEIAGRISRATVIRRDEPLAKHTTLRVGGPADVYVEPADENDLASVLKFCGENEIRFFILGRGSNLLVRDGGFRGVVICLSQSAFSKIEIVGQASSLSDRQDACLTIRCGAGAKLKNVSVEAKRNNLSGVEFLEGIPGSVGGALRMNAGAMGGATFDVVESVRVMDFDGSVRELAPKEMAVEYRSCAALKNHIALGAVFKCKIALREEIETRMKSFSEKRWESQPAAPSAGCIFKNPEKIPAGKLIEELKLKGARVGGAVVSAEHGNFIVNDGKATARDVLQLISILKAKAKAERGIELHTEVEIIGEDR